MTITDEQLADWYQDAKLGDYRICELIQALRQERECNRVLMKGIKLVMKHPSLNRGESFLKNPYRLCEDALAKAKEIRGEK